MAPSQSMKQIQDTVAVLLFAAVLASKQSSGTNLKQAVCIRFVKGNW